MAPMTALAQSADVVAEVSPERPRRGGHHLRGSPMCLKRTASPKRARMTPRSSPMPSIRPRWSARPPVRNAAAAIAIANDSIYGLAAFRTGRIPATGPKISSRAIRIELATPVNSVGST